MTGCHAGKTGFTTAGQTGPTFQAYIVLATVTTDNISKNQSSAENGVDFITTSKITYRKTFFCEIKISLTFISGS